MTHHVVSLTVQPLDGDSPVLLDQRVLELLADKLLGRWTPAHQAEIETYWRVEDVQQRAGAPHEFIDAVVGDALLTQGVGIGSDLAPQT